MPVFAQNAARIYIKRVIRLAICAKGKGVQFYLHAEAQIFIRREQERAHSTAAITARSVFLYVPLS